MAIKSVLQELGKIDSKEDSSKPKLADNNTVAQQIAEKIKHSFDEFAMSAPI